MSSSREQEKEAMTWDQQKDAMEMCEDEEDWNLIASDVLKGKKKKGKSYPQNMTNNDFRSLLGVLSLPVSNGTGDLQPEKVGEKTKPQVVIVTHSGGNDLTLLARKGLHVKDWVDIVGYMDTQANFQYALSDDEQAQSLTNLARPYNIVDIRTVKPALKENERDEYVGSHVAANDAVITLKVMLCQAFDSIFDLDHDSDETRLEVEKSLTRLPLQNINADLTLVATDHEGYTYPNEDQPGWARRQDHQENPGIQRRMREKYGPDLRSDSKDDEDPRADEIFAVYDKKKPGFVKSIGFATLRLRDVVNIIPGKNGENWFEHIHSYEVMRTDLKHHHSWMYWHEVKDSLFPGTNQDLFDRTADLKDLLIQYFRSLSPPIKKVDAVSDVPAAASVSKGTGAVGEVPAASSVSKGTEARSHAEISEVSRRALLAHLKLPDPELDSEEVEQPELRTTYMSRLLHTCPGNLKGVRCNSPKECEELGRLHICKLFSTGQCNEDIQEHHHVKKTCHSVYKDDRCRNWAESGDCPFGHDNPDLRRLVEKKDKERRRLNDLMMKKEKEEAEMRREASGKPKKVKKNKHRKGLHNRRAEQDRRQIGQL